MRFTKDVPRRATDRLPRWLLPVVERDEAFRFTALSLLDRARTLVTETEAKPPADSAAAALAALAPMHLALSAVIAAKGYRSLGMRPTLDLVGILYEDGPLAALAEKFAAVQALKIQGQDAIAAARELVDAAGKALT
jgi:hypothetical protein